ncbi:protein lunapark-A-like [Orbicella faveolata]|uniref:protein lunapark-A-like n=1 Tax=Orbicella faveolata TaxID=48498 RepID=UPI0009E3F2DB|nr:protein lunapark-A-like [Orbicella faveolata]
MGILFSRWRKKESLGEVLELLEKDIEALKSSQQRTEKLRKKFIGSLILYSILLYIVAALICYFYDFPKSWKAKVVRSIPLLVFPFVVYLLKRVLHYVFVSRMSKNARRLEELKERKREVLEEVMEKETYKAAKDLLDKYDPNSEIVKVERKDTPTSPANAIPQSPSGTIGTELRQRNVLPKVESPGVPLQRTISEPTLAESPFQSNQSGDSNKLNQQATERRKSNSLMNISTSSAGAASPLSHGVPHRVGSPGLMPRPAQPILPRDRTAMDKVIEYLVGDGPNNRYALICKQCCSHNGMALKEEFEYTAFRCCYCYHLNPARKQRPIAPKLDYDTWTNPRHISGQGPGVRHRKPTNSVQAMLEKKNVAQKDDGASAVNGSASMNGDHDAVDKTKEEAENGSVSNLEKKKIESSDQEQ